MSWLCDSKYKEFSFLMYAITISNYQIYMELEWLKLHAIMSRHGKSIPTVDQHKNLYRNLVKIKN